MSYVQILRGMYVVHMYRIQVLSIEHYETTTWYEYEYLEDPEECPYEPADHSYVECSAHSRAYYIIQS